VGRIGIRASQLPMTLNMQRWIEGLGELTHEKAGFAERKIPMRSSSATARSACRRRSQCTPRCFARGSVTVHVRIQCSILATESFDAIRSRF
jgi:hypothetical protein